MEMAPPIRRVPALERIYGSSWSTALALALVVGSVLFLVVFPRLASRRIESLRKDMLELAVPAHQAAGSIERAVALEVAAVRGYLLSGAPQFRTRFREASADEARAAADLQGLARRLGGDVPDRVAAFERLKAGWREPIAALMEDGMSREEYLRDLAAQQARFESIVAALQQVDAAIIAAEDGRRAEIATAEAAEDRWMVIASMVALLSAVVAGAIARRLRVLTRRAGRRAREEQELRVLARTLSGALAPSEVVQNLVDSAVTNRRASGAYVEQAHATEVAVVATAGAGAPPVGTRVPFPGSLTEAIVTGREPEIVAALGEAMTAHLAESCRGCAALVVPMFAEADLLGALILLREKGAEPFDEDDAAYARIVGDLASAALRRVTLLEQTKAERAALLASEEQFRAVAETAQVAIFVVAQDDTIVFANRPVERIFGYKASELIGQPLVTLIPAELRRNHRAGVERYVATGERRLSWEGIDLPAMSKDGREVPIELTLGEFFRDGRRYFTAIARDITERRRAEQEKAGLLLREREARERAEAAIRTREEVLAIVSHDLRNPLNTIAMGAAALKDFAADEATRERYVQMIQRAIQRMNRLIEDLLDVVRLEGGQKLALDLAPLELGPLLAELAESFRAQAEPRRQVFACELEPGLPTVTADRGRLAQVVSNLVGNALKFTPEGGRVELRAARAGEEVRIAVRDNGPGMSDEERGRIFDPYWQAGRTARLGAGLGLTISKGIVESHGGRLIVESAPGQGSTFTFTLPVSPAGAEGEAAPDPEEAPAGSGSS
jgi:PAS domain S-box-containing protein